jgi:hypothetical protein
MKAEGSANAALGRVDSVRAHLNTTQTGFRVRKIELTSLKPCRVATAANGVPVNRREALVERTGTLLLQSRMVGSRTSGVGKFVPRKKGPDGRGASALRAAEIAGR